MWNRFYGLLKSKFDVNRKIDRAIRTVMMRTECRKIRRETHSEIDGVEVTAIARLEGKCIH
jgi:hypothetical protein